MSIKMMLDMSIRPSFLKLDIRLFESQEKHNQKANLLGNWFVHDIKYSM